MTFVILSTPNDYDSNKNVDFVNNQPGQNEKVVKFLFEYKQVKNYS